MLKKINILIFIFLLLFTISSCKKDEPTIDTYTIYIENYFNWDECYIITPHEKISLEEKDNLFIGTVKKDLNKIIISNGTVQLPEVTLDPYKPYYCNGSWYSNRTDYSNIVYYSKDNEFDIPVLCFNDNNTLIKQRMYLNENNIYYGYISKNVNTYYYYKVHQNVCRLPATVLRIFS